ncbi:hypothetical protein Salat_2580400, partial [Sesamum alatum]
FAFQAVPWLFKKGSCEVSFTSILAFSLLVSQAFTSIYKRSSIISIPAFPIPWAMRNPLLRRKSLLTATWLPSVMLKGYAPWSSNLLKRLDRRSHDQILFHTKLGKLCFDAALYTGRKL